MQEAQHMYWHPSKALLMHAMYKALVHALHAALSQAAAVGSPLLAGSVQLALLEAGG